MGILISCCRKSTSEVTLITPDLETKRRQQAEAAEKRMAEQMNRGIKDPEGLKARTQRLEFERKRAEAEIGGDTPLKWTVG